MTQTNTGGPVDLLIKAGRIVAGGQISPPGWIAVNSGKIVNIGLGSDYPNARKTIDATGKYVLPGIVDPEQHPCMPMDESVPVETAVAVAAGVTTGGMMQVSNRFLGKVPKELKGPEDVPTFCEVISGLTSIMDKYSMFDWFLSPEMNNEKHFREIPDLAKTHGVTSFKIYTQTMAGERMWDMWLVGKERGDFYVDDGGVFIAMRNIAALGPPAILGLHCENWEIARVLKQDLKAQGRSDGAAWDEHSPDFCEAGQLNNYAYYARITGCPLYLVHTTTRETLREVIKARADGTKIIANTEPQYLVLDKDQAAINVPLRSAEDHEALWEALRVGIVNCVTGDSIWRPMRPKENVEREKNGKIKKVTSNVWDGKYSWCNGAHGFMLPVMLSEGVNKGRISLERLVQLCCENTAKAHGVYPKKGTIAIGSDADIVIVDLNRTKKVTPDMIVARVGWSIWEGWELKGWPVMTILRGNVLTEWPEGEPRWKIVGKPMGQYIPRELGQTLYPLS